MTEREVIRFSEFQIEDITGDNDIKLSLAADGNWQIQVKNEAPEYLRSGQYYKTFLLLEKPYEQTRFQLFNAFGEKTNELIIHIIGEALRSNSRHWIDLATAWIPFLSPIDFSKISKAAEERVHDKRLPQNTRHKLRKVIRACVRN